MQRSVGRFLSSHIGSLPRTPAALEALRARNESEDDIHDDEFEPTIATAVSEVVRRQAEAGVTVVNDGEQSKWAYMAYVRDRLGGFTLEALPFAITEPDSLAGEAAQFPDYYQAWSYGMGSRSLRAHACTGPVTYAAMDEVERDIRNLKSSAEGLDVADLFMSAISPGMVWSTPDQHYDDQDAYRHAVCDALAEEYKAITDAGIVVQIDCPDLGFPRRAVPDLPMEAVRGLIAENIEGLNYATRDIDPDMMRVHVCYGADEAPHTLDPELPDIVDLLLTARPNGLTVVAANGRHEHEYEAWRDVDLPDGKVIMPGVIDSTTNIVEHPDLVASRIVRHAEILGPENVIAGVDCGLDTIAGVHQVNPEVAWAKLASLGEGARRASTQIWG